IHGEIFSFASPRMEENYTGVLARASPPAPPVVLQS
ncbi:uncharacterized, partial [Tachysurus ichikawai]